MFSRFIQDFTSFGSVILDYNSAKQSGNATAISAAQQSLDSAAAEFRKSAALDASYLTYIGILLFVSYEVQLIYSISAPGLGIFITTYIYMSTWIYTGEVNTKRIREKYLEATLRQEIAYFDKVGPGEVTAHISTDTCERPLHFSFLYTQTR